MILSSMEKIKIILEKYVDEIKLVDIILDYFLECEFCKCKNPNNEEYYCVGCDENYYLCERCQCNFLSMIVVIVIQYCVRDIVE